MAAWVSKTWPGASFYAPVFKIPETSLLPPISPQPASPACLLPTHWASLCLSVSLPLRECLSLGISLSLGLCPFSGSPRSVCLCLSPPSLPASLPSPLSHLLSFFLLSFLCVSRSLSLCVCVSVYVGHLSLLLSRFLCILSVCLLTVYSVSFWVPVPPPHLPDLGGVGLCPFFGSLALPSLQDSPLCPTFWLRVQNWA